MRNQQLKLPPRTRILTGIRLSSLLLNPTLTDTYSIPLQEDVELTSSETLPLLIPPGSEGGTLEGLMDQQITILGNIILFLFLMVVVVKVVKQNIRGIKLENAQKTNSGDSVEPIADELDAAKFVAVECNAVEAIADELDAVEAVADELDAAKFVAVECNAVEAIADELDAVEAVAVECNAVEAVADESDAAKFVAVVADSVEAISDKSYTVGDDTSEYFVRIPEDIDEDESDDSNVGNALDDALDCLDFRINSLTFYHLENRPSLSVIMEEDEDEDHDLFDGVPSYSADVDLKRSEQDQFAKCVDVDSDDSFLNLERSMQA